jgi:hypothetical protein
MNINRDNYEEYFLLYIDNELTPQQKKVVDDFIQHNKDLAIELASLRQTILISEAYPFEQKNSLLKQPVTLINEENYELYFLLYVDNELKVDERKNVETFVLQHPQLQEVFTLLQQTKLPAETISYPNKNELYRKHEKPIVYFIWKRIAIAAVFVGLIFLVWNLLLSKQVAQQNGTVSSAIPNKNKEVTIEESSATKEVNKNKQMVSLAKNNNKQLNPPFTRYNDVKSNTIPSDETVIAAPLTESKNNIAVVDEVVNVPTTNSSKETIVTTITEPTEKENITNSLVQQALYKELDTDDDASNSLYIGNLQLNKNKLKGVFKKAKSIFSKSKSEDAKVSLASFPINTK